MPPRPARRDGAASAARRAWPRGEGGMSARGGSARSGARPWSGGRERSPPTRRPEPPRRGRWRGARRSDGGGESSEGPAEAKGQSLVGAVTASEVRGPSTPRRSRRTGRQGGLGLDTVWPPVRVSVRSRGARFAAPEGLGDGLRGDQQMERKIDGNGW